MSSWADHAIAQLAKGEPVTIHPKGNSMTPHVKSGAEVILKPYKVQESPKIGDIVLCRVAGKHYLHFIKSRRYQSADHSKDQYQIGNAKGGINGWVRRKNIFGRASVVDGRPR